jgi:hypothetical protein
MFPVYPEDRLWIGKRSGLGLAGAGDFARREQSSQDAIGTRDLKLCLA